MNEVRADVDLSVLRQNLIELFTPVVGDHRAELVDIDVVGRNNSRSVRLYVHKEAGVTIRECESISRELGDLLDIEDPIPGRYRLEVTSPGLDRPLVTDRDFGRAESRTVKVVAQSGHTVTGTLVGWDGQELVVEVGGKAVPVRRGEIARATIEATL